MRRGERLPIKNSTNVHLYRLTLKLWCDPSAVTTAALAWVDPPAVTIVPLYGFSDPQPAVTLVRLLGWPYACSDTCALTLSLQWHLYDRVDPQIAFWPSVYDIFVPNKWPLADCDTVHEQCHSQLMVTPCIRVRYLHWSMQVSDPDTRSDYRVECVTFLSLMEFQCMYYDWEIVLINML